MRLCTFQIGHRTKAGAVVGRVVFDLSQSFFRTFRKPFLFPDLLSFLEAGGMDRIREIDFGFLKDDRACAFPLREVRLRAPVLRPPKIVCVGLNYRDHAEEQNIPLPKEPLLFSKAPNATIGDGDEIRIPRGISEQVDYEVELAVVIATRAERVPRDKAAEHILGYTILNDVTARDIQKGDKQWFRGKSFATFAPAGPVVVTRDELDAASLALKLRVNGEERQSGNTANLIFGVPALIEFISACIPLEPGDIVSTGTPCGVGMFRNPPVWLKPGDTVEAEIEGIGTLTNPVV